MPWILFLHSQEIEKVIPWMSYLLRIQEREIQGRLPGGGDSSGLLCTWI